jgi:hypothetical protein
MLDRLSHGSYFISRRHFYLDGGHDADEEIEEPVPTYTYSGNFGPPASGLGCGLALSRLYAKLLAGGASSGGLALNSLYGVGTDVFLHLDADGDSPLPLY